ncbi:hypothetical protein [Spartinivicinus poritis]|uniref:Molecular chaperone n=1 Tax=Spartinivicinus poritis TaxID=2994640 RepID=A0ABT5U4M1_9GAMM|nr:hypothetical protein [Spartinivicinus sp. A2-2]MDE1461305.1 hypothetical protein [Spartinivicinus sp. A2-2]
MNGIITPALKVPKQIRTMLSFAPINVRKIEAWLNDLPRANLGMMSKQLYHAVVELNQLKVAPEIRQEMMESIRPSIYYVCHQLSQHFLGQVIVLSPQQRKVANLALTLLYHLSTGYKHIVLDLLARNKTGQDQALLADATHRAISDISHNLLQALQLFAPVPQSIWLELNQLYLLAEQKKILNHLLEDNQNTHQHAISIADCYKRIVMLCCSRPNQVRQQSLRQIFHSLELWGNIIEIAPATSHHGEFIIAVNRDTGPKHTALVSDPISDSHRIINSTELRNKLKEFINTPSGQRATLSLTVPEGLTDDLLNHLIKAWGPLQNRAFKRISSAGSKLIITVGLSATHYYYTDEVEFKEWLHGPEQDIPQKHHASGTDTWSSSFAAANTQRITGSSHSTTEGSAVNKQTESQTKKLYPLFTTDLINSSPGGYCVNWQGNLPNQLQTGELVGLHEDNSRNWSLAVIRWIKLLSDQQAQLGIELLTPNAKPCAVALLKKVDDDSQFMRGFFIPPIKALSQPASLITPKVPFQVGHKVKLSQGADIFKGQLVQQITSTGSFSMFELQGQDTPKEDHKQTDSKDDTSDEDFSSLWEML